MGEFSVFALFPVLTLNSSNDLKELPHFFSKYFVLHIDTHTHTQREKHTHNKKHAESF